MKTCYAYFDDCRGVLCLGNQKIEKRIRISGNRYRTEAVRDKISGAEWSGEGSWQQVPVLRGDETGVTDFEARERYDRLGIKPHLEATLSFRGSMGSFRMEFMIFPEISFIYSCSLITAESLGGRDEGADRTVDCSGIEKAAPAKGAAVCALDTLECIPLGRRHLEVESVLLTDKTDINDTLVERQTAPVYSRGAMERNGNIFCINDYYSGDSIMLVKHSPAPSSALNRASSDLIFRGDRCVQLMGVGVDHSALPAMEVPYYASAVGVGRSEEIWDAYMRYSDVYEGTDPRRALFVMSNTWGDRSQDVRVCEEFILGELECARRLGIDIMQIDDGWQSGVTSNSRRAIGGVWEGYYAFSDTFWQVDPARFPNGLTPIVERAAEYGVEVGLWFSPDSSRDFANVERDVETLMGLYQKYGVRHFKLDGIKIRNKLCETRLIYLLDRLSKLSGGEIQFNLDITAEDRFGYLYKQWYGTLFVENRYTDWGNYYPHRTFRNVWDLAGVIPTRRLQMELLNVRRNRDKYEGMPFSPDTYGMDYLFASVMVANPLVWAELSGLSEEDSVILGSIISVYKRYKSELYSCRVYPVGERPNGMRFSGFQCVSRDGKSGHLLLFRETTAERSYTFALPRSVSADLTETLYRSADAEVEMGESQIKVTFSQPRSFVWLKYHM